MIATVMLSEIANDNVRGILTASLFFTEYFGIWLAYVIGNFDLTTIAIFSGTLMVVFFVLFCFFPESGHVLVKFNKMNDAEKSISFYKNIRKTDEDSNKKLVLEIDKLKMIMADAQRETEAANEATLKWSDFATKAARKAIVIGIVLVILCMLNGVFTYYTAAIFKQTGSNMSENMSAIVAGGVPVIAIAITMYFVDRIGRKVNIPCHLLPTRSILILFLLCNFSH